MRFHDIGRQDGFDYLVMEYLEGETLAKRLDKGALTVEHAELNTNHYVATPDGQRFIIHINTAGHANSGLHYRARQLGRFGEAAAKAISRSKHVILSPVNIERTIEFILKSQARAEVRAEAMEKRFEAMEKHAAAMEKRFDKRIAGITKLMTQGMKMLARVESNVAELADAQKRTDIKLAELAEAQKATDRSLKAFIDSLRNGHNGR